MKCPELRHLPAHRGRSLLCRGRPTESQAPAVCQILPPKATCVLIPEPISATSYVGKGLHGWDRVKYLEMRDHSGLSGRVIDAIRERPAERYTGGESGWRPQGRDRRDWPQAAETGSVKAGRASGHTPSCRHLDFGPADRLPASRQMSVGLRYGDPGRLAAGHGSGATAARREGAWWALW